MAADRQPGSACNDVAFYSNVLRNRSGAGIVIQPHNDVPREIRIFDNTIIRARDPVVVRVNEHTPQGRQFVFNNAVFSPHPLRGGMQRDNAAFPIESAATVLVSNGAAFDPFPRDGRLLCPGIASEEIKSLPDVRCDFNGSERAQGYWGAYAGQTTNPGWLPVASVKPATICRAR